MKKWMAAAALLVLLGGLTAEAYGTGSTNGAYPSQVYQTGAGIFGKETQYEEEVLRLVNEERRKAGVRPLTMSTDLMRFAAVRAEEISRVYSHTRPNGQKVTASLDPHHHYYTGENIGAGYHTPADAVDGWMHSPGHRENILRPEFKEIGIGYHHAPNTLYSDFWVQVFRG